MKQNEEITPYPLDRYTLAIIVFLLASLLVVYFRFGLSHQDETAGYYAEIVPSDALSCIDEERQELIPLPDGVYPLCLPSGGEKVTWQGRASTPLFLVPLLQDGKFRLYPLNIRNDSLIERHGPPLVFHIRLKFHSRHAENCLPYLEKDGTAVSDAEIAQQYTRKFYYYLLVQDGYGELQLGWLTEENTGSAIKWYKQPEYYMEELAAIHYVLHGYPAKEIEQLALESLP